MCQSRGVNIERCINFLVDIIRNPTVMDYAIKYNNIAVTLGRINQVRLYKKVLLPCKLVRLNGDKLTSYYYIRDETSLLK